MRSLFPGAFFLSLTILTGTGCSRSDENSTQQENLGISPAAAHNQQPTTESTPSAAVAGIEWKVPEGWRVQPQRPMRIATYTIPKTKEDMEDGECAVFFFGAGQGGGVRSNIERWISQFETQAKPEESSKNVNGIPVTTVSISGDYLASGGPMMQSQGKKLNYRLLGAIVEAPEGAVFFKTTGPAATISDAEKDFASLVNSVRKTSKQ